VIVPGSELQPSPAGTDALFTFTFAATAVTLAQVGVTASERTTDATGT